MAILGIDPGTATTGYGLIQVVNNNLEVVEYGLIETERNGVPGKRLYSIYKQLSQILKDFNPEIMAIEKLFFAANAKTAMQVGQAQGVMLFTAASHNVPVVEYTPGRIKKIISGNGRADKLEMQKSIRKFLGSSVRKKKGEKSHFDNAADALAVAICHVISVRGGDKNVWS